MKIISLNLAGRKNFEDRLQKIVNFLDSENADFVCLQEVTFDEDLKSLANIINERLINPYNYSQADLVERYLKDGKELTDGLAILSRQKMTNSRVLTLTKVPADERGRPDFHKRIAQIIELESGTKIVNTHLASNNNACLQLRELLGLVPENCILTGDFNMPKNKMLNEKDWRDVEYNCSIDFKDYISFPKEGQTFDYALIPKSMRFVEVEVVSGLSDHNAVICKIVR